MFAQIMEGRASDPAGVRRLMDRWIAELEPGATGYLGSTGGVAEDGRAVLLARFESPEAARANSERPEQGRWWSEMEKCFAGPVDFTDSTDVETFRGGGSDEAGFVQVMKDSGADRDQIRSFDDAFERLGASFRPDLLGGVRVWTSPDSYVEFAYFTSEAEARAGEQEAPPEELASTLESFSEAMAGVEFIDLTDPMLNSA